MHQISFSRALQTCKNGEEIPFYVESADKKSHLKGVISHDKTHYGLLKLSAKLEGTIPLTCDRSGEEYEKRLDETLCFYLSDGIISLENGNFEDILECLSGVVDFYEILNGELEMIRCDYHIKETD